MSRELPEPDYYTKRGRGPTCKEALIDIIRAEGFDFMTAGKIADEIMADTLKAGKRMFWNVGGTRFSIAPKGL